VEGFSRKGAAAGTSSYLLKTNVFNLSKRHVSPPTLMPFPENSFWSQRCGL